MHLLLLGYLPSLLCGIHAVRTGRMTPWLWILVIAPGLGPLIYVFAVLAPEWFGGPTARRVSQAAVKAIDPEREYRGAQKALEDARTVGAVARLGHAAFALGRLEEAEALFREATAGSHQDDADLVVHHVKALAELGRWRDALERLRALEQVDDKLAERPDVALLFARSFEGLERPADADAPYRWAADRLPGMEAPSRYAAFLARSGQLEAAEIALAEIDRRVAKVSRPLRAEAQAWRSLAAKAIAERAAQPR